MRGYFEVRFSDKKYLTCQAEYRFLPVWKRFGITAFADAGQVVSDIDKIAFKETKFSAGLGIRYIFDEEENINVRLDIGVGNNSVGIYLNVMEAF